jgi:hypothetical protein
VAQSVVLGLQRGNLLALRLNLLLLLLNGLDDRGGQLAIGNAIGTILVVLPLDQRKPVLGFRFLDCVMQRNRQGLFEILRDKAIALGLVAIVETVGYRFELLDEIEAEIGIECPDIFLAPTVRRRTDRRDISVNRGNSTIAKRDRFRAVQWSLEGERRGILQGLWTGAGLITDGGIVASRAALAERAITDRGIAVAYGVTEKCAAAEGVIKPARCVGVKRERANGVIICSGSIGLERLVAEGIITEAYGIGVQGEVADSIIDGAGGVEKERYSADRGIARTSGVARERV